MTTRPEPELTEDEQQKEQWDFWQARLYGELIEKGCEAEGAMLDAWELRDIAIQAGFHWVAKTKEMTDGTDPKITEEDP